MARDQDGASGGTKRSAKGAARRKPRAADRESGKTDFLPDGKLYYRIGEVAKITQVKPHVLRYWETEFRWMTPPKSRSKQRLYRRKDIEMILVIKKLLYDERYTIAGARLRLREMGLAKALETNEADEAAAATDAPPAATGDSRQVRDSYRRIRDELKNIRALL